MLLHHCDSEQKLRQKHTSVLQDSIFLDLINHVEKRDKTIQVV